MTDGMTARMHRSAAAGSPSPGNPSSKANFTSSTSGSQQKAADGNAATSDSGPDRRQSVAAPRRVSSTSPGTAAGNASGATSPSGHKYSLLLARLPRGEGIVDMACVDHIGTAARSPHRLLPSLRADGARAVSPGGTARGSIAAGDVSIPQAPTSKWRQFTERAHGSFLCVAPSMAKYSIGNISCGSSGSTIWLTLKR